MFVGARRKKHRLNLAKSATSTYSIVQTIIIPVQRRNLVKALILLCILRDDFVNDEDNNKDPTTGAQSGRSKGAYNLKQRKCALLSFEECGVRVTLTGSWRLGQMN